MEQASKQRKEIAQEDRLLQVLVPDIEQPFAIPENWKWCYLQFLSQIKTGKKDANYGSENGRYLFFTCAAEPIRCDNYSFEGKAILLAGNGDIGNISLYDGKFEAYQRTYVLTITEEISTEYLYFYFKYRWVDYNTDKMFGTAIPYIRLGNLQNFPVPLAPAAEQQRIVDRIESLFTKLDEAKEKAQAVVDGFEDRKAAILHKAFTGELTEKWRYNNGVTLESWNTENLEESFDVSGGIQKQPSRMPDKNPVPYITVANVYRNRIDLTDLRYFEVFPGELEKLQLKYGDILIAEGNGSGSEIGRCAMWRNELPVCIHQNHIIRVRRKNESVPPEYVLYYLNSSTGRQIMKSRAKTTAGLYNLSTGKIKTIPVPFASLGEQKEIVRMLGYLLEKEQQVKDKAETTIEEIDNMKKSILARAFRGELGTNDPNDESAIELLKRIL